MLFFLTGFLAGIPQGLAVEAAGSQSSAVQQSAAFKKAERDARRMLNWWKYKMKKDPEFLSFPGIAAPRSPLGQHSVEEEPISSESR